MGIKAVDGLKDPVFRWQETFLLSDQKARQEAVRCWLLAYWTQQAEEQAEIFRGDSGRDPRGTPPGDFAEKIHQEEGR